MAEEEWRGVPGYPHYEVSNLGRVRSVEHRVTRPKLGSMTYPSKVLKPQLSNAGYLRVSMTDEDGKKRQQSVHRAVALAFIPNPEGKREVNHINGNRTDNRVENLEWSTPSQNCTHRDRNAKVPRDMTRICEANRRAVIVDGSRRFASLTEAAEYIGSSESAVCSVLKGRQKSTHGHTVAYA